jgi:hypothetical protein
MYTGTLIADLLNIVNRVDSKSTEKTVAAPIPTDWKESDDDIQLELRTQTLGILTVDEVLSNVLKGGR